MGCFFLGLLAYGEYGGGRLDGVGGPGIADANTLAVQLGTGAFAAFAVYLCSTGVLKWLSAASIPFILNTVVMTGARGGFVAILAGALAFVLFRPVRKLKVVALYALVGAAAFVYVANDFFWERMSTIPTDMSEASQVQDGSVDSRLAILDAQWKIFLDHPFGGGHRTTTALSYNYIDETYHSSQGGRSSHNTFMSMLVDQGFIGLLLWTSLLWALIRRVRRIRVQASNSPELGWLNASIAASISVITVAGMFYPLERLEAYVWLIGLTCASVSLGSASADAAARPHPAPDPSGSAVPTIGYNTPYPSHTPPHPPRRDAESGSSTISNKW
jgi:O-antigen ligase